MKQLRRWWWNWSDSIGLYLWLIVGFIAGAMAWIAFDLTEKLFR